jgi:hypothetical protein
MKKKLKKPKKMEGTAAKMKKKRKMKMKSDGCRVICFD